MYIEQVDPDNVFKYWDRMKVSVPAFGTHAELVARVLLGQAYLIHGMDGEKEEIFAIFSLKLRDKTLCLHYVYAPKRLRKFLVLGYNFFKARWDVNKIVFSSRHDTENWHVLMQELGAKKVYTFYELEF